MRLGPSPRPSTLTILALLFLDFDPLPLMQPSGALHTHTISGVKPGGHLNIITAMRAEANGTAFDLAVAHQQHNVLAVVIAYCSLRNERARPDFRTFLGGFFAKKRHLDAHVRQNSWIQFIEGDTHLDGSLLAISRRNDGAHLTGNLPIGIRVKRRRNFLLGTYPLYIGL